MIIQKIGCLFLCCTLCALAVADELVVVVSSKNPLTSLRAEQVADIFLAQTGHFPDGAEAIAIDQRIGSNIRDEFYVRIAAKSPALIKSYWTKMIFTGRGQPPKEMSSSIAVRKMVAENPSLIGYIDKATVDDSVKTVLVVH